MTVRVDRRPRARRTTRGPPMREARYGSPPQVCRPRRDREGLEIRRPERQAMMTVVVITTVVAGVHRLPVWGAGFRGPIFRGQSRTRCGAPGPCPRLPPNRCLDAPPHGGFHSTNHGRGMSGREIVSAAFCRSGTFLSSVIRETRSAATFVAPQHRDSDRAPARPGLRHRGERLGLGDITQPAVRVPFP